MLKIILFLLTSYSLASQLYLSIQDLPPSVPITYADFPDQVCAISRFIEELQRDVVVINYNNVPNGYSCSRRTYKISPRAFENYISEACTDDFDCTTGYCDFSSGSCQGVPLEGKCGLLEHNGKVVVQKCEKGLFCKDSQCERKREENERCSKDSECLENLACGNRVGDEEIIDLFCRPAFAFPTGTWLLPGNYGTLCKSGVSFRNNEGDSYCTELTFLEQKGEGKTSKCVYEMITDKGTDTVFLPPRPFDCSVEEKYGCPLDTAQRREYLKLEKEMYGKLLRYEETVEYAKSFYGVAAYPLLVGAHSDVLNFFAGARKGVDFGSVEFLKKSTK